MKIIWIEKRYLDRDLSKTTQFALIENLIKLGNKVEYFVPKINGDTPKYVKFIPLFNRPFLKSITFYFMLFLCLPFLIYKQKPNLIIIDHASFFSSIHMIILSKFKFIKSKFILYVVSPPVDIKGLYGFFIEVQYCSAMFLSKHLCKNFIFLTEGMKNEEGKKFKINFKKTRVGICHCGVDKFLFNKKRYKIEAKNLRQKFGLNNKFIVMYHGVLAKNRGLQEVIKSISKIKENYPEIVLFILGFGQFRKELESLVKKEEINNNVIIHGPVEHREVPIYLAMSNMGIIPLPNHRWWRYQSPLKLFENLAMEKPVILTDIPAHKEVIKKGKFGFFITSNKKELIAEAIIKSYNKRNKLDKLGKIGRKMIIKTYSWEGITKNLEKFFKEVYEHY